MKYTIKQISEIANVAQSTVSKALNGQKGVSEEKRREILKLAGEVNYRPNANARALAQNKTETIGLIVPESAGYSLTGVYWSEMISSVAEEANKHNYNLLLIVSDKEKPFQSIENTILKRSVDGLIIPAEQLTIQELNLLKEADMPFVIQGRSLLCEHYCVDVRSVEGMERITNELIGRGYKNIGCITGPESFLYTRERIAGFKKAMTDSGLKADKIISTLYSEEETIEAAERIIKDNPSLDALCVAAGGEFIFYILETLKKSGVNLNHFGIAAFDEYKPLHWLPFPVITAKQPIKQMGTQNARNLFQLINKETPPSLSLFDITIIKE